MYRKFPYLLSPRKIVDRTITMLCNEPWNLSHDTHISPLHKPVYFVQDFNPNAAGPSTDTTCLLNNQYNQIEY